MQKSFTAIVALVGALAIPAIAGAHEGHMHRALGTIVTIHAEHVEIKTTDGKTVTVVLDKKTTVTRGKDKLDVTALKVGERLSVDYVEENKTTVARAIRLATTTGTKK
jgi:hypothetical protein